MIQFTPRTNQEREACRRVPSWHVVRHENGRVLIAESARHLSEGDLRWIDRNQINRSITQ